MIAAYALGAAEAICIHAAGDRIPVLQIVAMRSLGNWLIWVVAVGTAGQLIIRSRCFSVQLARGGLGVAAFAAYVIAFARLPLVDATALLYLRALLMAALAAIVLRETVGAIRWAAIAAGLVGAALVIQPSFRDPGAAWLAGLAAPAFNAAMQVVTRFALGPTRSIRRCSGSPPSTRSFLRQPPL